MSNEIAKFYDDNRPTIENYLSKTANDDFFSSVQMILSGDPKWKEVVSDQRGKIQLIGALKTAASVGLSLNPALGKSAVIPYKGKHGWIVSYQAMKNGLIDLALQSGSVKYLTSGVVKSADEFSLTNTPDGASYSHSPARTGRGETDGYYAALKFNTGESYALYITREEAREHAAKYSQNAKYENGVFIGQGSYGDSEDGMHVKTVIKMLLRNVHVSDEVSRAMAADDNFEDEREINEPPKKTQSPDDLADRLESNQPTVINDAEVVTEPGKTPEMF
jgi:phage RecT family recombinase